MKNIGPVIVILSLLLFPISSIAQLNRQMPNDLKEVGITEKLGEQIPLNLKFANAQGDSITLEQLFDDEKPVILNPVYYECPQLCSMVKEAIFKGINTLQWNPGEDYTIITFSIDPNEKHKLAALNKQRYLNRLDRNITDGWYFLTGNEQSIRQLTEAVGFNYQKLKNGEFAHGAAIMFLSPNGTISRYLYGLKYDEFKLRNALYEAADGEIGSTTEQILLYCYQYDADSNSYVPVAWKVMKLGGFATFFILSIFLGFMWLRYRYSNNTKQITDTNGSA